MMKWWVYMMIDPRDREVFYIGATAYPLRRWSEHHSDNLSPAARTLREIKKAFLKPRIRMFGPFHSIYKAQEKEQNLIKLHQDTTLNSCGNPSRDQFMRSEAALRGWERRRAWLRRNGYAT